MQLSVIPRKFKRKISPSFHHLATTRPKTLGDDFHITLHPLLPTGSPRRQEGTRLWLRKADLKIVLQIEIRHGFHRFPRGWTFQDQREVRWLPVRSPKSWNWNWNSITQGWATTTTSQFFKHCLKGLLLLLLLVCTREINRGLNLGWDFSDVHWVLVRGRCRLACLL